MFVYFFKETKAVFYSTCVVTDSFRLFYIRLKLVVVLILFLSNPIFFIYIPFLPHTFMGLKVSPYSKTCRNRKKMGEEKASLDPVLLLDTLRASANQVIRAMAWFRG